MLLAVDVETGHRRPSRGGLEQGREDPHRCRLAGAVGTQESEYLAFLHLEVEPGDSDDRARKLFSQPLRLYRVHVPFRLAFQLR